MIDTHIMGVWFCVLTAVLWAVCPMMLSSIARKIGSFQVVLLRGLIASGIILAFVVIEAAMVRSIHIPSPAQISWLILSGVGGIGFGDLLLYRAIVILGARRTLQIEAVAPAFAVMMGWICLSERLHPWTLLGIGIVLAATVYCAFKKAELSEPGEVSSWGFFLAVTGAFFVAVGAVAGRQAYLLGPLDTWVATAIRILSASSVLWLLPILRSEIRKTIQPLWEKRTFGCLLFATIGGWFLGTFFYLQGLKRLPAGVAMTLISLSPLIIIPISAIAYHSKIRLDLAAATAAAIAGVAMITF